MLFKISSSFFYTQKVAYFVQKQVILIRSNPTNLCCIADQTRSKYDHPTLYRRPPRCTPAQHTTCGERDNPRQFFNRLKNWSRSQRPLRAGPTNPAVFRPTYALPDQGPLIADPSIFPERERAGVDRLSGVNGPLAIILCCQYIDAPYTLCKRSHRKLTFTNNVTKLILIKCPFKIFKSFTFINSNSIKAHFCNAAHTCTCIM